MLQGKDLILATKPFAKEIFFRSWYHLISTLGLLILSLSATIFLDSIWLKLTFSILAGLITVRMFIIYHDHQHGAILGKSIVANIIMKIFGFYILAPTSIWKRSHDYHHKNNSKLFSASIGSYPIMTKQKFLSASKKDQRRYLVTRHPLVILAGYFSMFIVGMCINSFNSNPKKHIDSLFAIIVHFSIAVVLAIAFGWMVLVFTWLLPLMIAHAIGAYLFYVQHNFPGVTFKDNADWSYDEAAMKSSSYLKMNKVMEWFTGNIGYHHIHHLNAKIPFYRLPETLKSIPELQKAKTTSFKIKDVVQCLRLKVWDPESNRMLALSEL